MYMISRDRISGTEFQVWALTPEEILRQNRKDAASRRRGIVRSFCHRWLRRLDVTRIFQ